MGGVTGVGHQDHVVVGTPGQKVIFVHGRIRLVTIVVLDNLIYVFSSGVNVHMENRVTNARWDLILNGEEQSVVDGREDGDILMIG
tara:strand:- start:457 stop:714 length:258 start_codon:yes stop_codon:yes gene_type:complete